MYYYPGSLEEVLSVRGWDGDGFLALTESLEFSKRMRLIHCDDTSLPTANDQTYHRCMDKMNTRPQVGMVPGVVLIVFLGIFATFTAWALIQFKLRHPSVHSRLLIRRAHSRTKRSLLDMGDAGLIIFSDPPLQTHFLPAGSEDLN